MEHQRTLFHGVLVQKTGLHVGGGSPSVATERNVHEAFFRDGSGRLTLRGSGVKGALAGTVHKLMGAVPGTIRGQKLGIPLDRGRDQSDDGEEFLHSAWIVHNSHPLEDAPVVMERRTHVGISHDTGARSDGVLFALETTAAGTRWGFLLEVDATVCSTDEAYAEAERLASAALMEWSMGRAWLGGHVARGLGWVELSDARVLRVPANSDVLWPDSTVENVWVAASDLKGDWLSLYDFHDTLPAMPRGSHPAAWSYCAIDITLEAGMRADTYGCDSVSVGGVEALSALALNPQTGAWQVGGRRLDLGEEWDEQIPFAITPPLGLGANGAPFLPFIPGSGFRGALRAIMSRIKRMQGRDVPQPHDTSVIERGKHAGCAPSKDPSDVEYWFGSLERSARLLVADACLSCAPEDLAWAATQHHAEDEFAGGVFGGAKFERAAVYAGTFRVRLVLEVANKDDIEWFLSKEWPVLERHGRAAAVPLGGAVTRGHGSLPWTEVEIWEASAGEPWRRRPSKAGVPT